MSEILVGFLMGIDAFAMYLLLPFVKYKLALALWTGFLHMLFPAIGYVVGDYMLSTFNEIAQIISIILLFCVGLQFMINAKEQKKIYISPVILAFSVSLDTFSVSVSFGMLGLHKYLFIVSAALGAFMLSYFSLKLSSKTVRFQTSMVNKMVGIIIIGISIWSYINL